MKIFINKLNPNNSRLKEILVEINKLRQNYPWSEKVYGENDIDDVYLICGLDGTYGFIECKYQDVELNVEKRPELFLSEIHIAPNMQGKGVGEQVLKNILKKELKIEMVIANKNHNMLKLVKKFDCEFKYDTGNVKTAILTP